MYLEELVRKPDIIDIDKNRRLCGRQDNTWKYQKKPKQMMCGDYTYYMYIGWTDWEILRTNCYVNTNPKGGVHVNLL
jgi:hypothetical protein